MNASSFASNFRHCLSVTVLISAAPLLLASACLGQADATAARNNYVVSVQNLKAERKAHTAFTKGSQMMEEADALGSIPYLQQAVAEYPEHYEAYYDLGVAHFRLAHLP